VYLIHKEQTVKELTHCIGETKLYFDNPLGLLLYLPGTPVFSTNNTNSHDITEILLKGALNTIKPLP
jgi:hypothetical protein